MASQWFLSRFEYRLTCSFWRYRLLFLGTPEPVFSWTSTRGDLVDRRIPKEPDTWTVLTVPESLVNTLFGVV